MYIRTQEREAELLVYLQMPSGSSEQHQDQDDRYIF